MWLWLVWNPFTKLYFWEDWLDWPVLHCQVFSPVSRSRTGISSMWGFTHFISGTRVSAGDACHRLLALDSQRAALRDSQTYQAVRTLFKCSGWVQELVAWWPTMTYPWNSQYEPLFCLVTCVCLYVFVGDTVSCLDINLSLKKHPKTPRITMIIRAFPR